MSVETLSPASDTEVRQGALHLALAALALALGSVAFWWPGSLNPDSQSQLAQALSGSFSDWHPPIMARIWSLLRGSVPAMLGLQVGLHWLGFWGLAEAARRAGRGRRAWIMLAVGLTPIAGRYLGTIAKDTLLASALFACGGVSAHGRSRAPALIGGMGALCRINGVFALPQLVVPGFGRWPLARAMALCLLGAFALLPVVGVVNHDALGARPTRVERSLQVFDLVGIARVSGDRDVLPGGMGNPIGCYSPLYWDAIGRCIPPVETLRGSITAAWLNAIARHPLAYAQHRAVHFNREIFFATPPLEECVDDPAHFRCDATVRGVARDLVLRNIVVWPVTWLAIGLAFLLTDARAMARRLALSGVAYGLMYAVVGVASDIRYFYWTELSVQAAIAYQFCRGERVAWKPLLIAAGGVFVVGYGARLALAPGVLAMARAHAP